jgi:hypothetical protein
MRQAGVSVAEIARRFNIGTRAVNAAVQRQLTKMNQEALMAYPEVLRMELERLDALQQSIWPLTQHRRIVGPDGVEVNVEPDMKAIQQVLSIMDKRAKLLGMEQANINVSMDIGVQQNQSVRVALDGVEKHESLNAFSPETEARKLLEIMGMSGVLPVDTVRAILSGVDGETSMPEIIEAEIVENEESDESGQ